MLNFYSVYNRTKLFHPTFASMGQMFFLMMEMSLFFPTLPLWLTGAPELAPYAGLIVAAQPAAILATRLFSGFLADKIGLNRLAALGHGLNIFTVLFYSTSFSLTSLILARIAHGANHAFLATTIHAQTANLPANIRTKGFAYVGIASTLGLGLGPFLGSYFQTLFGVEAVITWVWIAALSHGLCCYLSRANLAKHRDNRRLATEESGRNEAENLLPFRTVTLVTGLMFGTYLVHGALSATLALWHDHPGGFLFLVALVTVVARGGLLNRKSLHHPQVIGALWGGQALALVGLGIFPGYWYLWAIPYGLTLGLSFPLLMSWIANYAASHQKGRAVSLPLLGFDGGMAAGSFLIHFTRGGQSALSLSLWVGISAVMIALLLLWPLRNQAFAPTSAPSAAKIP